MLPPPNPARASIVFNPLVDKIMIILSDQAASARPIISSLVFYYK
jgi:hypothetical protein